jgi:hypothetical protein
MQETKTSQADFVSVLEMPDSQRHQVAQHCFGLLLH